MFIASDTNVSALSEIAWRASRKPARGGVPNLICLAEPVEALSRELGAIADRITIILPWASLLRAVATPEIESLCQIAHLCLPGASVEIVLSYDQRDARQETPLAPHPLREEDITALPRFYEQAGLRVAGVDALSQRELHTYETTWASRLASGRKRRVWRIRARRIQSECAQP